MTPDLSIRIRQNELMDDPSIDPGSHQQALRGLRRINWFSRIESVLWAAMLPATTAAVCEHRQLTVLDIASGGGDLVVRLGRRFCLHGIDVRIDGCDISSTAVAVASRSASDAGLRNVRFHQCNVFEGDLPGDQHDVVMCSLFLHHLDQQQAVHLMQIMKYSATALVLVDDLCRSRIGYWLAWAGCRLLSRSPVVHADGPMSVEGAFTCDEATRIAEQAGMDGTTIQRHWPQRFLLKWKAAAGRTHV
ncbi:MAG: methyltransferase domain-containing protein [Planctomycetaceae bacterium]